MELTIRRLQRADAEAVSALVRRNILEVNMRDYPEADMLAFAAGYDENKIMGIADQGHSYVALHAGKLIGCGSIAPYLGRPRESILLAVFVLPELHGRGIGRKLVAQLEADPLFVGADRVLVHASITAYHFYRSLGYDFGDGIKRLDPGDGGHYTMEKRPHPL